MCQEYYKFCQRSCLARTRQHHPIAVTPRKVGIKRRLRRRAKPGRAYTRDAEAWAAEIVDHLRRGLASRFGLAERDFPDAVIAALGGRVYLDALDRRQQAAARQAA